MDDPAVYQRIVAIGDLNGALGVLREILQGTGVIDERDHWIGGATHVIQIGDIFDRGGGQACACLRLLRELGERAPESGGRVTLLLGNHEIMAVLGDRRWHTVEECLSFATDDELDQWHLRLEDEERALRARYPGLPDEAISALMQTWKRLNAPGRTGLERALRVDGEIGAIIQQLPVAVIAGDAVFCHGGLDPEWAQLGLDGLEARVREAWRNPQADDNIFHDEHGPLWNRKLAIGDAAQVGEILDRSLACLGVARMVVGHTSTARVSGGSARRIATRMDARLVCIDVGLQSDRPGVALVIDDRGGHEWRAQGERLLWQRE